MERSLERMKTMKKVGVLHGAISGNIGDIAIGLSVKKILRSIGVEFEELIPGNFNPNDYETIIIGGGLLLNPSANFFFDKFKLTGNHILNAVGISGSPDDLHYLDDYKYITVRSSGDKKKLSYLKKEVHVVPCTTMILKDLKDFRVTPKKPSIGIHLFPCFSTPTEEEMFIRWASNLPFNIYFIPITHYTLDYIYLQKLSLKIKNSVLLPILKPLEIFTFIGKLDYFISCSLHGGIFSYIHNVPFILYTAHEKMRFFMEDRKLQENLFTNFYEIQEKFENILNNPRDYSKEIAKDRKELDKHIDNLSNILNIKTLNTLESNKQRRGHSLREENELNDLINQENYQIHSLQLLVINLRSRLIHSENSILEYENQIFERDKKIIELENKIKEMQNSIMWQLAVKHHGCFVERMLPPDTYRRGIYDRLLISGMNLVAKKVRHQKHNDKINSSNQPKV